MIASIIGALNKTRGTPLGTASVASYLHPWPASGYRIALLVKAVGGLNQLEPFGRTSGGREEICVSSAALGLTLSNMSSFECTNVIAGVVTWC
jgi:hypothetical protein